MFPTNWFWHADDGRVFAAARHEVVSDTDPAFLEAKAAGQVTRWPADDSGVQTDAALQEVLKPYNLWVDLTAYAADRRWRAEQNGTVWNGWPIHTDDRSQAKYLSELQAIALDVRVDGDPWNFADGVFRPVSNAEFASLAIKAREHVRTVYGIEGTVQAQIAAGAITKLAQIDAAFEAVL